MSEFPVKYFVDVTYYNGEDSVLDILCADIPSALDMLRADLDKHEGLTEDKGCLINYVVIEYGDAAIMFTPTDSDNSADKSGTLTIYFGGGVPLAKRESIDLFIEDYTLLRTNDKGGII